MKKEIGNDSKSPTTTQQAVRRPDRKFDLERYMVLARNSFRVGKFELACDYCRQIADTALRLGRSEQAEQAYYIWCLANLKSGKYAEAKKVCFEARAKLGNNLNLLYFETLIAAVGNEIEKVPKLARNFKDLWNNQGAVSDEARAESREKLGEVLLMWGQALEQMRQYRDVIDVYNDYLKHFPEDAAISERINELASRTHE